MPERCYASTGEYAHFIGATRPPDELDRRLMVAASRRVDRHLVGVIYDVDDRKMPTDPDVREALRDATCAQAEAWLADGDTDGTGVSQQYATVSIGDVNLARGAAPAAPGGAPLASKAADILLDAGLTTTQPWVFG